MIEVIIREHLYKHLGVPVYLEEPINPPVEYIVFEKTSSSKSDRLCSSTYAFQSYSSSMYDTALLNNRVKLAVESMIELREFAKIRLNSDYNYTDTRKKKYRYQAVFDIYHY